MILLVLSLLLAVLGAVIFPCWRHSARCGYTPSAIIGVFLVFVALLVGGKSTFDASAERLNLPQRVAVQRADAGLVPSPPETTPTAKPQLAAESVLRD